MKNKLLNKNYFKLALISTLLFILYCLYHYFSSNMPINSDVAAIILQTKDIWHGNVFLKVSVTIYPLYYSHFCNFLTQIFMVQKFFRYDLAVI